MCVISSKFQTCRFWRINKLFWNFNYNSDYCCKLLWRWIIFQSDDHNNIPSLICYSTMWHICQQEVKFNFLLLNLEALPNILNTSNNMTSKSGSYNWCSFRHMHQERWATILEVWLLWSHYLVTMLSCMEGSDLGALFFDTSNPRFQPCVWNHLWPTRPFHLPEKLPLSFQWLEKQRRLPSWALLTLLTYRTVKLIKPKVF